MGRLRKLFTEGRSWHRVALFLLLAATGGAAGFLYYLKIGCVTGTCAITANPMMSTLYGGVLAILLGIIILPTGKKQ